MRGSAFFPFDDFIVTFCPQELFKVYGPLYIESYALVHSSEHHLALTADGV